MVHHGETLAQSYLENQTLQRISLPLRLLFSFFLVMFWHTHCIIITYSLPLGPLLLWQTNSTTTATTNNNNNNNNNKYTCMAFIY